MEIFKRRGPGRPRKAAPPVVNAAPREGADHQHDGDRQAGQTGDRGQALDVGAATEWDRFVEAVKRAKSPVKAYCPDPKADAIGYVRVFRGEYCYIDANGLKRGLGMN